MAGCRYENGIVLPGDFMLSLERFYQSDGILGRTPAFTFTAAKKSRKGPYGKRGLGLGGQEWYCLECVERMCENFNGPLFQNNTEGYDDRFTALFAFADRVLSDERFCEDYLGCFRPHIVYRFGLELWKAIMIRDQSRVDGTNRPWSPTSAYNEPHALYLGDDGECNTWFLNDEAKDIDYHFPSGVSVKTALREADVRGKRLSEVLSYCRELLAGNGTVAPEPEWQRAYSNGFTGTASCWRTNHENAIMAEADATLAGVRASSTRRRMGTNASRPTPITSSIHAESSASAAGSNGRQSSASASTSAGQATSTAPPALSPAAPTPLPPALPAASPAPAAPTAPSPAPTTALPAPPSVPTAPPTAPPAAQQSSKRVHGAPPLPPTTTTDADDDEISAGNAEEWARASAQVKRRKRNDRRS